MNPEMTMVMRRNEEREALKSVIQQWNANRLDLFELSEPNENLEFHGVMRFYFQDSGQKVATKCIRVASDATAQDVVETLIEKFRPDMRMLSLPEYALFEIHENGEERKLAMDEKPLLVQLNWHKDDREGRFLLRRLDDKTNMPTNTFQQDGSSFRRKLSKREKKQLKKQEKLNRLKSTGAIDENDAPKVAEKLYSELPETSFTRSISNPEAVMRRRRQRELERKLQLFRSKDGGPDTGGTLKIYGESLCRDVPYKTLLLSIRDNAQQVVKEMLIKYGLEKEDPHNYCLVQVNGYNEYSKENNHQNNLNNNNMLNCQEYILDDDECPLAILMSHAQSQGSIMFHVRRRPADYHPRKRKKKPQHKWNQHQSTSNELLEYRYEDGLDRLPLFLELNPDGTEICGGAAKRHRLHPNVTEVGCERNTSQTQSQYLQLFGPNILPRHCVIANTEGIVTVTPCSRDSETYVNGQRIYETTILRNGSIVKFGRIHCFRFLDPFFEERIRQRQDSLRNIHEFSTYDRQSTKDDSSSQTPASQTGKEDSRSQRSIGSNSNDGNRIPNPAYHRQGTDAILPAVLEIKEETEETLLNEIITALDPNTPSFKLAPAYCLYLMARYRASTHYRPELTPTERAHRLTLMLARVASIIQKFIQERYCDIKSLALWLANSSELLFFLQFDRHLFAFSKDARRMLAESVQISFRHLVGCVQSELSSVMPLFFADKDDTSHESEESPSVLAVLSSAMSLLRRYRVNVALTVQLFSHLFHFINVWAFNRLIAPNTNYCSRLWGLRLKSRLAHIEAWAERQGLEISTDTHLAKIKQAAHLLQAPKYTADDLASLSSLCFLLNSLQLRALLLKYQTASDEPPLPREHIENVVKVAESLADELARSDGREVKLEEDPEFALEFVLPIDSYSCEVVRGIPPGLVEFITPLQNMGLCRLSTQPTSNGLWTVYMELPNVKGAMMRSPSAMSNRSVGYLPGPQEPEIQTIKLHKSNNGMGLSIVAAKGAGQDKLGIYIKSVVKGGAADIDGRLLAGDQLLKVDDQSLVGITQEKAAEYLVRTGPIVTLEVAKQGAIYHGLATLLSQPSPVLTRADRQRPRSEMFAEAFQRVVPASVSMINLNENARYADSEFRWAEQERTVSAGATRTDADCELGCGDGGSVGKTLRYPRKLSFQPRYGNLLHPDYALLYPSNACQEQSEPQSPAQDEVRGILTTTNDNHANRMPPASASRPAYTPASAVPYAKLCTCEDVLQRPQQPHCSPQQCERKDVAKASTANSITKRIVSDVVTSCCLGVAPESDVSSSTCADDTTAARPAPVVATREKSVMTDEAYLVAERPTHPQAAESTPPAPERPALEPVAQAAFVSPRNLCPLSPPTDDLCACEKRIFGERSDQPTGRLLYRNGDAGVPQPSAVADREALLEKVLIFNERYCRDNVGAVLRGRAATVDSVAAFEEKLRETSDGWAPSSSRRSSSDDNLSGRTGDRGAAFIAECAKCGNRFDVRAGTYFSGATFENVSSTSSTTGTSSSGTADSSTSSASSERGAQPPPSADKDRKLTKEEREAILKELEEIISGDLFCAARSSTRGYTKPPSFTSSMLHLDLNSLKGSSDSDSSASDGGRRRRRCSSNASVCEEFKLGRVAELTRHFSGLGEAGIIKAKTKSAPNIGVDDDEDSVGSRVNYRSASVEELRGRGVTLHEVDDDSSEARIVSEAERPSECFERRRSFARQDTVFCKMRSVDELDQKRRRQRKRGQLYRYASVSDFRLLEHRRPRAEDGSGDPSSATKKIVSFDDLDVRKLEGDAEGAPRDAGFAVDDVFPPSKFCLESLLRRHRPNDEALRVDYERMTSAIRDYLANKELLLERMKSNSVDGFGAGEEGDGRSRARVNRTRSDFACSSAAGSTRASAAPSLRGGMSLDAIAEAPAAGRDERDDFVFKDNIRRVYKGAGGPCRGRRARKWRRVPSRRSVTAYPAGRQMLEKMRCLSLDAGEDSLLGDGDESEPSRGRRMSERDLPSRVMNEPPSQTSQLPMHTPIHSSKSVPSLNSPCGADGQIVSPVASRSSHEVFNTGYNSTPSSNGIHQPHPSSRSRSSQNLNDSRSLNNYPATISGSLPNRQPSNPNLLNNAPSQYGQHYNQLPPHQQQQHPMYHQHVQQQQMLLYQQQQQQQQQQQYLYSQHNSSSDNGERFYQNLNVYRNQELQNGSLHENSMNSSAKGKVLSPQQERASNQFQRSFRGSQTSLQQQPQGRPSNETLSPYMRDRPSSAYMQKENFPPSTMNMSNRSQSTRDMLRQEAKLQEMSEEVRRREMRSNYSPQQQHFSVSPPRNVSATENLEGTIPGYHHRPSPGTVMYVDGQPIRPPYPNHKNGGLMRPTLEEIGYRESPPPPPPPPTSTHPLYQTGNSQRSPDNRYTASVGEPPKGGYYPSSPVTSTYKNQIHGTNPWEREEREKEAERRREAAKEWRDQQIRELSSLGPNRNQSQEEQLRTLKLDKEFERRAQEEDDDDDEDQEASERVQDLMRAAREQDELKSSANKSSNYSPHTPSSRWSNSQPHMNGTATRYQATQNAMEEKERLRRLKDMKMKQVEQEALKAEESRMKYKDDEPSPSVNGHAGIQTIKTLSRPTHLRLDTSTASSLNQSATAAAAMANNVNAEHVGGVNNGRGDTGVNNMSDYGSSTAPQQRLDHLLEYSNNAPPPPERGSSFAVMSQAYRSPAVGATTPSQNYVAKNDVSVSSTNSAKKMVSFQEMPRELPASSSPPAEKVLEDPNRFIHEAESMLASPKSPDTQFINATPGVIGNQEVYKDPRQKRLAEQQHQKLLSNKVVPVPEKLTFKEKMKMFAMETGEEGTPKDKVKISRAQRDIDNLNSPSTPGAGAAAPKNISNGDGGGGELAK